MLVLIHSHFNNLWLWCAKFNRLHRAGTLQGLHRFCLDYWISVEIHLLLAYPLARGFVYFLYILIACGGRFGLQMGDRRWVFLRQSRVWLWARLRKISSSWRIYLLDWLRGFANFRRRAI